MILDMSYVPLQVQYKNIYDTMIIQMEGPGYLVIFPPPTPKQNCSGDCLKPDDGRGGDVTQKIPDQQEKKNETSI